MKIPRRFTLLGTEFTVTIVPAEKWDESDAVAYCIPETATVKIKRNQQQMMEHAYLHELMHLIVHAIGNEELYKDEAFIDMVSGLIHQALVTSK